jgi:hypothetical protein
MDFIWIPEKLPEEEGYKRYESNCTECGTLHELAIPVYYPELPACDVDRMGIAFSRQDCDGVVYWQPPDDSKERIEDGLWISLFENSRRVDKSPGYI